MIHKIRPQFQEKQHFTLTIQIGMEANVISIR